MDHFAGLDVSVKETSVCIVDEVGKIVRRSQNLQEQVRAALAQVGRITGKTFGDGDNPLLVAVRSGARASMPGMMDTVLNLGLNDATVEALAKNSPATQRFACRHSFRRFITMYSATSCSASVTEITSRRSSTTTKARNGYTLHATTPRAFSAPTWRAGFSASDPFVSIDREGVGELVRIGVERG